MKDRNNLDMKRPHFYHLLCALAALVAFSFFSCFELKQEALLPFGGGAFPWHAFLLPCHFYCGALIMQRKEHLCLGHGATLLFIQSLFLSHGFILLYTFILRTERASSGKPRRQLAFTYSSMGRLSHQMTLSCLPIVHILRLPCHPTNRQVQINSDHSSATIKC